MVTSPTNGNLAFAIILAPSSTTSATKTSSTSILTTIDEGKLIGHAGIWQTDRNELVFMLSHAYWNQGYMTEVLTALVPIFWEKGLKTVFADVEATNGASTKVLRKCGFVQVGQNVTEIVGGRIESPHMELRNPDGGGEEGCVGADGGSDGSSEDSDRNRDA